MTATGLNGYINAQGFPKIGMFSIVLGAAANIALDPVFIFVLDMGVAGAALATIISQGISALWVMRFLLGSTISVPLRRCNIRISRGITKDIFRLGTANFIMQGTNCLVQVACNATLQQFGGDLYVGIMTVLGSIREIFVLPINGIVSGSQSVISYNYGARAYDRVRSGIRFNTWVGTVYTTAAWLLIVMLPRFWFGIFNDDPLMTDPGVRVLKIYFFGFVFMSLQFAGQTTFQALGDARHAIFFSLLRKAIIVVPLTLLLPRMGFGVDGVFLAEPISNVIGGAACYLTMKWTVYRHMEEYARRMDSKE
jgi:Na+-driven multidrug efflux pump